MELSTVGGGAGSDNGGHPQSWALGTFLGTGPGEGLGHGLSLALPRGPWLGRAGLWGAGDQHRWDWGWQPWGLMGGVSWAMGGGSPRVLGRDSRAGQSPQRCNWPWACVPDLPRHTEIQRPDRYCAFETQSKIGPVQAYEPGFCSLARRNGAIFPNSEGRKTHLGSETCVQRLRSVVKAINNLKTCNQDLDTMPWKYQWDRSSNYRSLCLMLQGT